LFKQDISEAKLVRSWIQRPPAIGSALKVVKYDHVAQKITFEVSEPTTHDDPVPNGRKHRSVIENEMQDSTYKLDNVGISMQQARNNQKSRGAKPFHNRKKCDTCLLRSRTFNCNWLVNDGVCTNCRDLFGRPWCTWTVDIPAAQVPGQEKYGPGNDFPVLQGNNDLDNIMRRSALVGTPTWGASRVSERPIMIDLDTGDDVMETGDDGIIEPEEAAFAAEDEGTWVGPSDTPGLRLPS